MSDIPMVIPPLSRVTLAQNSLYGNHFPFCTAKEISPTAIVTSAWRYDCDLRSMSYPPRHPSLYTLKAQLI